MRRRSRNIVPLKKRKQKLKRRRSREGFKSNILSGLLGGIIGSGIGVFGYKYYQQKRFQYAMMKFLNQLYFDKSQSIDEIDEID